MRMDTRSSQPKESDAAEICMDSSLIRASALSPLPAATGGETEEIFNWFTFYTIIHPISAMDILLQPQLGRKWLQYF